MIISPKYKFVFTASAKTGSSTIHETLLNCVKDKNLIDESTLSLGDKHLSCPKLIEQRPQYKDYFKFAFVRNPWDRVLSWYFFYSQRPNVKVRLSSKNETFNDFILNKSRSYRWGGKNQSQYNFTKCCDFIGKFENLQEDFDIICDKIGIPHQKLPHFNKTKHKHYTEYYDEETKEVVAKKYAKDIEYFGYKFGK